jgi:ferredoxin
MIHVWIDQDLCTGDGLCTDHCPDVFVLLEDGISYVRDSTTGAIGNDPGGRYSTLPVAGKLEQQVIDAALDCPGECIFIEVEATYERNSTHDATPQASGPDVPAITTSSESTNTSDA